MSLAQWQLGSAPAPPATLLRISGIEDDWLTVWCYKTVSAGSDHSIIQLWFNSVNSVKSVDRWSYSSSAGPFCIYRLAYIQICRLPPRTTSVLRNIHYQWRHTSYSKVVRSAPSCWCCTPMTAVPHMERTNPANDGGVVCKLQTVTRIHIGTKSTTSDAQRTIYCSSAKPRSWSLILEKSRRKHTNPCLQRWSKWTVSGSWESASQRTCHGHLTSPHWLRRLRNDCVS